VPAGRVSRGPHSYPPPETSDDAFDLALVHIRNG